ncbi:hypothetical protein [Pseudomonas sp. AU12215]|uniref:hypothetical protein n=1 Tax=Pseudomonas sp. AU12215 TaxID=1860123 RepID=UPI0007EE59EE|nr:hypothetical protein [Pseudomonas sp. AU12215]OBY57737.1 hypothetical protein A9513_005795 [Pseudomonas sp. AU12215]
MLSSDQKAELAMAIVATAEVLGQLMSANAAEMIAEDLAEHPVELIANALRACRRELTGKLTLAAILQRVHGADGRPEPNEAWAIAMQSMDEAETVLMTPEIQKAAAAATPIYEAGDKVGARMAFISAYERFTLAARQEARPVSWALSLGHDQNSRARAIEEARVLGRLPAPTATLLLTHHNLEPAGEGGRAIAGLLTGDSVQAPAAIRERLEALRTGLDHLRRERAEERRASRMDMTDEQRTELRERSEARSVRLLKGLLVAQAQADQLLAGEIIEITKRAQEVPNA